MDMFTECLKSFLHDRDAMDGWDEDRQKNHFGAMGATSPRGS
jgi:hypothetical protein